MKRSIKSFAKKASNLSESIYQQLSVYAVAAVVAVVSVLALAPPSQAKIVYTHANVVLSCPHSHCQQEYNLDLNHDGVTDFTITVFIGPGSPPCDGSSGVAELPASGNRAIGSGGYAAALMQGAPIGHSQQFQGSGENMAYYDTYGYPPCSVSAGGPWYEVTDRYLGLSFRRNGRTHYGWARLTVSIPSPLYAKLTGYAYETIAGKSINAGQKKEAADEAGEEDFGRGASLTNPIPDTPQPASRGMLALGAQGIPLWRRKESVLECAGPLKPAPIKDSDGYYGYYSL
jgi:hypothetical protein